MHKIDGLKLKFTNRTSWMADVYKDHKKIATVPVAWADQIIFDKIAQRPLECLVWHRTETRSKAWAACGEAIIAIANAVDPQETPRRFKEFVRVYKVQPIGIGENPLSVRAKYIDLITAKTFTD